MVGRVVSPVFVGRTVELSQLTEAFHRAAADGPGLVLVAGEAGIGKTRLVAEFAGRLDSSVRVLRGSCRDGVPYAPFHSTIRQLVREIGTSVVRQILPGPQRSLANWLPELGAGDDTQGKAKLFEEIGTILDHVSTDRPLVLIVEDLQWADTSSRELLTHLSEHLTQPGILLVGITRTTADNAVEIGPLSSHEVGRQVASILGREPDPANVKRTFERSRGNPLRVEALLAAGDDSVTELCELFRASLRNLPDGPRAVLHAAAVIGRQVGPGLLAAAAGKRETELENPIHLLVDRGLLITTDTGYSFRHHLIYEAAYADIPAEERVRLHANCARALTNRPSLLADGRAHELATHWHAADEPGRALAAAWRAAAAAARSYGFSEQLRLLERVLELWDRVPDAAERIGHERVDVLELAAETSRSDGDPTRGQAFATEALAEIDERKEPERAARMLLARAGLKTRANENGHEDLLVALRILPSDAADLTRATVLVELAASELEDESDVDQASTYAEQALAMAHGDARIRGRALAVVSGVAVRRGDLAAAARMRDQSRELSRASGDRDLEGRLDRLSPRPAAPAGRREDDGDPDG
ncbi:ATP-binding protein [Tenggerimyces flavus]|uniref:ATP-binding protein n=1 Tax=Tenggerimyces flavus TaxID=1708749 RepID=A0ABV7YJM8_9ACTN|nr:AAA family ATPase [Tenggerimyces flavus]MBM7784931.1 putative ATPase [Tenggerimyces flavus]